MDQLLLALIAAAFLSPVAAFVAALVIYFRHRQKGVAPPGLPVAGFLLVLIMSGAAAGGLGLFAGIGVACTGTNAGNLCGLWGVFITGPICAAIAILAVAFVVCRRRSPT